MLQIKDSEDQDLEWRHENFLPTQITVLLASLFFSVNRFYGNHEIAFGTFTLGLVCVASALSLLFGRKPEHNRAWTIATLVAIYFHTSFGIYLSGPSFGSGIMWIIIYPVVSIQLLDYATALRFCWASSAIAVFQIFRSIEIRTDDLRLRWLNLIGCMIVPMFILIQSERKRSASLVKRKKKMEEFIQLSKEVIEQERINKLLDMNKVVFQNLNSDILKCIENSEKLKASNQSDPALSRIHQSVIRVQSILDLAINLSKEGLSFTDYSDGEHMVDLNSKQGKEK